MVRLITYKPLNRMTLNDTISCFGGLEVTLQNAVPKNPGSIPCCGKYIFILFFVF